VAQRNSELTLAGLQLERSLELVGKGFTPQETVDQRQSSKRTAEAAINTQRPLTIEPTNILGKAIEQTSPGSAI
jgi:multidrug resistance efflux pump